MKKSFPLHLPGKADARVLDAIKHDVRKYVKRERRKPLPDGFDVWRFECKVGSSPETAEPRTLQEISNAIDAVAKSDGASSVYVEVNAVPGNRRPGEADAADSTGAPDQMPG
jgi:hypothetical protein